LQPARPLQALAGTAFEESGVDWMALAVDRDTDLVEVVVWYYEAT
jgi:hypothetical protein